MSRAVIVLGQHRSGTSAVASILHHLGIPMGTPGDGFKVGESKVTHFVDGWPAYESNPCGQFEDNDFVRAFLEGHGNWEIPKWWKVSSETEEHVEALVRNREDTYDLWGLKTPQLCYTLSYLLDYCADPVVISTHRDFDSMAESLARRDKIPLQVSEQIQANYFIFHACSRRYVKHRDIPLLDLHFNSTTQRPAATTELIMEFIGLPHDLDMLQKAAASIRPQPRSVRFKGAPQ